MDKKNNYEDKFFKLTAKTLANRAGMNNCKCYVDPIEHKPYERRIVYKQKDLPSITLILSKKDLQSGHAFICALLAGANRRIQKDPTLTKLTFGRIRPSKTKNKKNVKLIKTRGKVNKKVTQVPKKSSKKQFKKKPIKEAKTIPKKQKGGKLQSGTRKQQPTKQGRLPAKTKGNQNNPKRGPSKLDNGQDRLGSKKTPQRL